jgi:heme exporter protein D
MDLGPHATFIIASYAATGFIIAMLIGWIVAENRALKRALADFESRGITRRSDERKIEPRASGPNKSEAHSLA